VFFSFQECQNLIEENRRLLSLTTNGNGHIINGNADHCSTVEAVILQNQVETLQWQLKQVIGNLKLALSLSSASKYSGLFFGILYLCQDPAR
jgi:hypothetical protein